MRRILVGLLGVSLAAAGCAAKKPATITSQAIGPGGGSVTQGAVTLTVPAGAVTSTQNITVTQIAADAPAGYTSLSPLYQFGPDGLVFAHPVTVSLGFAANATAPVIYWSNASGGYDAQGTTVSGTTAQAQVAHFSSGFVAEAEQATSSAKALTAFSFAALSITATIDESAKTISATVPKGTDVTALVATFATTGASVTVGAATQVSATTANDFSDPVVYTVTAADNSTASYTATVQLVTLDAPVITYPVAGSLAPAIAQPATVQGTAAANATIDVAIMNGETTLGTASGTADSSGVFNLEVTSYTAPAFQTALSLVVTQSLASQTSPAATLAVQQGEIALVPISVNQSGGATTGTTTYTQVFTSSSASLPLQQHAFTVTAGANEASDQYAFSLPSGGNGASFYFFSFRDSNDNGVFDTGEPTASAQKNVFQQNATYNITLQ